MKRILLSLFVILTLVATSCNQGNNSNSQQGAPGDFNAEERVNQQLAELDELLDLSKDQEKQMYDILMTSMDNMMQMREEMRSGNGDRESMREKMMQVREEQNAKIKDTLSGEQFVKYEEYEQERRARRGQGRQGGRPQ